MKESFIMGNYVLEKMKYEEDSREEIVKAIKSRVRLMDSQIIYYQEVPVVSPFSAMLTFGEMHRLAKEQEKCAVVIDLRDTGIPDAITRRHVNKSFKELAESTDSLRHVAFITGKNFIINTAARFAVFQTSIKSFSISKTKEEALVKTQKALNEVL